MGMLVGESCFGTSSALNFEIELVKTSVYDRFHVRTPYKIGISKKKKIKLNNCATSYGKVKVYQVSCKNFNIPLKY